MLDKHPNRFSNGQNENVVILVPLLCVVSGLCVARQHNTNTGRQRDPSSSTAPHPWRYELDWQMAKAANVHTANVNLISVIHAILKQPNGRSVSPRFVTDAWGLVVALRLASRLTLVSSAALAEHSGLTNRSLSLHSGQLKTNNSVCVYVGLHKRGPSPNRYTFAQLWNRRKYIKGL